MKLDCQGILTGIYAFFRQFNLRYDALHLLRCKIRNNQQSKKRHVKLITCRIYRKFEGNRTISQSYITSLTRADYNEKREKNYATTFIRVLLFWQSVYVFCTQCISSSLIVLSLSYEAHIQLYITIVINIYFNYIARVLVRDYSLKKFSFWCHKTGSRRFTYDNCE